MEQLGAQENDLLIGLKDKYCDVKFAWNVH